MFHLTQDKNEWKPGQEQAGWWSTQKQQSEREGKTDQEKETEEPGSQVVDKLVRPGGVSESADVVLSFPPLSFLFLSELFER